MKKTEIRLRRLLPPVHGGAAVFAEVPPVEQARPGQLLLREPRARRNQRTIKLHRLRVRELSSERHPERRLDGDAFLRLLQRERVPRG